MFLNKISQNKLTLKNFKTAKYHYDLNLIKKSFKNKYVLIYYYDFLSKEQESMIKNILNKYNLNLIKIKKNLLINYLKTSIRPNMLNLIQNNTFIIINKDNSSLNSKLLINLNSIKNIHLIGSYINKKFLRPSQIKKRTTISKKNTRIQTLKLLNLKNYIKNTIILKKTL